MSTNDLRKVDRQRLVRRIVGHLEDFARQVVALETAMAEFGENFELARFKEAFNAVDDPRTYNRVQSVERAIGRVQNYLTDLAIDGVRLVGLPVGDHADGDSKVRPYFVALRDERIIDPEVCGGLEDGQKARSRIEHEYLGMPAGDVHRAANTVSKTAEAFIGPYRAWIEPYLD
jgi:hypothetical protein